MAGTHSLETTNRYAEINLRMKIDALRTFRDRADANRQLRDWILGKPGNRIHGSTHEKPLVRFTTEQPLLQSLPAQMPEPAVWAKAKVHCYPRVQFEKCLHSVPFRLKGQTRWLKAIADDRV